MAAARVGERVASIPKGLSLFAALVVFLPEDVFKGPGGFLDLLGGCLRGFYDSAALYFPGDTGESSLLSDSVRGIEGAVTCPNIHLCGGGDRVHTRAVSSGRGKQRQTAPQGSGSDGYRWQVRAWCFENSDFRDFVLSRIEKAEWPEVPFTKPTKDGAWEREVTVVVRANSELDEERRKTIERDYGMKADKLQVRMCEAMREYYLAHLRVADEIERPRHLEVAK